MCSMRVLLYFILPICLTILLIAGQGIALAGTLCCAESRSQENAHSCCPQVKQCHKTEPFRSHSEAFYKHLNCQMKHAAMDLLIDRPLGLSLINPEMVVSRADGNPVHPLCYIVHRKPLWLHRLFYPDKSALYLENQHLLL